MTIVSPYFLRWGEFSRTSAAVSFLMVCALLLAGCSNADSDRVRQSEYVPSGDGTRLAVDAWLPSEGAGPWPTVIRPTTQWRDFEMRRRVGVDRPIGWAVDRFTGAQFALVVYDARGTGASYGTRDDTTGGGGAVDAADGIAVVDWVTGRPWSNGDVLLWGEKEDAILVDAVLVRGHDAIRAASLRFADWNRGRMRIAPGGLPLQPVLAERERRAKALDAGDPCGFSPRDCDEVAPLFLGPRPVDGDEDGALRAAAIAEHRTTGRLVAAGNGELELWSPHRYAAQLAAGGVPVQLWASWWEGETARSALARFAAVDAPQTVIVGHFGPGGAMHAAPGGQPDQAADPAPAAQFDAMIAFFRNATGAQAGDEDAPAAGSAEGADGGSVESALMPSTRWDVEDETTWPLGGGAHVAQPGLIVTHVHHGGWLRGDRWPPASATDNVFYLGEGGTLMADASEAELTSAMSVEATSGPFGRFVGRLEAQLAWPDRKRGDSALLTFDSAPSTQEHVWMGDPQGLLAVRTEPTVSHVHAYLEAILPDGRVLLVSEAHAPSVGASTSAADSAEGGSIVSSTDAGQPSIQDRDETNMVSLSFSPVAIRVPAGTRTRVAFAAADTDAFGLLADQPPTVWHIALGESRLELPMLDSP